MEKHQSQVELWPPLNLANAHSIQLNIPKLRKKETGIAESTAESNATHNDCVSQNCSRANRADVSGWGGVSSGLNPIIDVSHCVPRQQYISNRALFKSSGLISGKTVCGDLALTGHTVPVKSDRVCVCLWCMRARVCVCKCTKKRVISWRQEAGVCAGVRTGTRQTRK